MRSLFGATLPLAGPAMYEKLTPQWAGTLLGLLEVCLIPIPFVFYRYGEKIRSKSRIIRQMREDLAKNENRLAKQQQRLARKAQREREAQARCVDERAEGGVLGETAGEAPGSDPEKN